MEYYKHTQIGYLMVVIMLGVLVFFAWLQITARAEPPSADSGANFAITAIMALILFILASFVTLRVVVDGQYLKIRFGWGIRLWFWPKMWIFNVSGFDAVELTMKNGKIYRIGTDEPDALEQALGVKRFEKKS